MKSLTISLTIAATSILFPIPALAERWYQLYQDNETSVAIDLDTVQHNPNYHGVTDVVVATLSYYYSSDHATSRFTFLADCTYQVLYQAELDGSRMEKFPMNPGSLSVILLEKMCDIGQQGQWPSFPRY
jgi:hypothetical protein